MSNVSVKVCYQLVNQSNAPDHYFASSLYFNKSVNFSFSSNWTLFWKHSDSTNCKICKFRWSEPTSINSLLYNHIKSQSLYQKSLKQPQLIRRVCNNLNCWISVWICGWNRARLIVNCCIFLCKNQFWRNTSLQILSYINTIKYTNALNITI